MIDVFERERQEIVDKIDKLKTEYEDSFCLGVKDFI
jgi:hypothetical protein